MCLVCVSSLRITTTVKKDYPCRPKILKLSAGLVTYLDASPTSSRFLNRIHLLNYSTSYDRSYIYIYIYVQSSPLSPLGCVGTVPILGYCI